MTWIGNRLKFLFRSTKGLILVAIAFAALISAFLVCSQDQWQIMASRTWW